MAGGKPSLKGIAMQKWEYLWIYVDDSSGTPVYIANGERLSARTYAEALNNVGRDGWELVTVVPPASVRTTTHAYAQFCLKRPLADESEPL